MNSQQFDKTSTFTLNTGRRIPLIGLGTYLLLGEVGVKAIKNAFNCGYTHLDTASLYKNEDVIRRSIEELGVSRDKLYITSKID
jgi:diketogulonate reductase-like aldo/keto reductase